MRLKNGFPDTLLSIHTHTQDRTCEQASNQSASPEQKLTGLADTSQNAFASVITTHPRSLTQHPLPAGKSQLVWSDGSCLCHLSHPSATPP